MIDYRLMPRQTEADIAPLVNHAKRAGLTAAETSTLLVDDDNARLALAIGRPIE